MLKRIITLLLVLCISLLLGACGADAPQSTQSNNTLVTESAETTEATQTETTVPETSVPETSVPETTIQQKLTLEQLLDRIMGIWIFDETIVRQPENMPVFDLVVFDETACTGGVYPGELFRSGQYNDFTPIDENTYQVDLLYPAGMYMDDYYEESHSSMVLVLLDNGKLQAKFGDGEYYTMTYGGDTFEEAAKVAFDIVRLKITPTTQILSEHSGYRIIREDRSGRNHHGQVLASQYYDYVELTADNAIAQKINTALNPDMSIFFTEEELAKDTINAEPGYPYIHEFSATVSCFTDKWLCVVTTSNWFWGGVHNAGNSASVFDMSTGEQVTLRAFAGDDPIAFEAQIKQLVWEQIQPLGPWENAYETLSYYTLDTFNFAISDGEIILFFPEYEFFSGAHGPVTIQTGLHIE